MNKRTILILAASVLAVLLVVAIVIAMVVTWGNDDVAQPTGGETTGVTETSEEDITEPDNTDTTPAGTTEASDSTEPSSTTGSNNQGTGNKKDPVTNTQPTEGSVEEEKEPTIGVIVEEETTPSGEEKADNVIDFDDLLNAGKKNG